MITYNFITVIEEKKPHFWQKSIELLDGFSIQQGNSRHEICALRGEETSFCSPLLQPKDYHRTRGRNQGGRITWIRRTDFR
jgi:hypothetical protein